MDPALVSATPQTFREHMAHLKRRFHPVDLAQVLDSFVHGAPLPPRSVHVTFDDAYRDFAEVAWPILRELGIPVTVFVPTAYPGDPTREFWWDRLHKATTSGHNGQRWADRNLRAKICSLPHDEAERLVDEVSRDAGVPLGSVPERSTVLTWSELRKLRQEGVEFGAHTRCHVALTQASEQRIREEIRGSLEDVQREIGCRAPTLAYPYGLNNALVRRVAGDEGCVLAFTVEDGLNQPGRTDRMAVRRTNITLRTSPRLFALRMLPWFADIDRWRHRSERPRAAV